MANVELQEAQQRAVARRRIEEMANDLRLGPGQVDVEDRGRLEAQDRWRGRMGVVAVVVAMAVFVVGLALLTMSTTRLGPDGIAGCGTALSNPGWDDGHPCHRAVTQAALWGGLLLAAAIPAALIAALYRWGPQWWSPRVPATKGGG